MRRLHKMINVCYLFFRLYDYEFISGRTMFLKVLWYEHELGIIGKFLKVFGDWQAFTSLLHLPGWLKTGNGISWERAEVSSGVHVHVGRTYCRDIHHMHSF